MVELKKLSDQARTKKLKEAQAKSKRHKLTQTNNQALLATLAPYKIEHKATQATTTTKASTNLRHRSEVLLTQQLLRQRIPHENPRHHRGVSTQEDVCPPSGHVGGDGYNSEATGLPHDLALALHQIRTGVQRLRTGVGGGRTPGHAEKHTDINNIIQIMAVSKE